MTCNAFKDCPTYNEIVIKGLKEKKNNNEIRNNDLSLQSALWPILPALNMDRTVRKIWEREVTLSSYRLQRNSANPLTVAC